VRVRWLPAAVGNVVEIREYIKADNPTAADRVVGRIAAAAKRLSRYPNSGRAGPRDTREAPVARTAYVIVYRVEGQWVEILRVFHGAQVRFQNRTDAETAPDNLTDPPA
jgi:plasmid stabilization system protein ParE